MNNTFNINRFGMLLRRQWQEFGKIYLVSLGVLVGVLVCFYAFNIPDPDNTYSNYSARMRLSFREPIFLGMGFLFITVVSSSYFMMMGQKPRAIIELMVPCSPQEKFLAGILFTSFLSIGSYLLIFWLTDIFFIQYLETVFAGVKVIASGTDKLDFARFTSFASTYKGSISYPFCALGFALSSLFLLGSVYFNRFHYIKTAGFTMMFGALVIILCYKTSRFLFEGKIRVMESEEMVRQNKHDLEIWGITGILVLLTIILWFIGYLRLKEKEV